MYLSFAEQLRVLLKQRGMTIQGLSENMKITRQNLNQKINRNNFSEKDMKEIAEVMGLNYFVSLGGFNTNGLPMMFQNKSKTAVKEKKGDD